MQKYEGQQFAVAAPSAPYPHGAIHGAIHQVEESPLKQAISSLNGLLNHASEIRHSLGNLADRVGGPVTTTAADGSVGKISDHSQMDALHGVISQLGSALDHIAAESARLNRLVG